MHRGTHQDLVAFITGLLRRSVRSVGTTVKPVTAEFGMRTSSSGLRYTSYKSISDVIKTTLCLHSRLIPYRVAVISYSVVLLVAC